ALQNRVAVLLLDLTNAQREAAGDDAAVTFVQDLHAALARHYDDLAATGRLVGTTDFDVYETKLPLLHMWIALRKELRPRKLPPATRTLVESGLSEAAIVIANPAATAADVTQ